MQKSLIICATPRSGSYLLSDLLQQGGLPFAEEWLTPFHQSSRKKAYGEKETLGFVDYLKCLSKRERVDGIFTMKIMYPQFYVMKRILEGYDEVPGKDWFERFQGIFPNPHFVHISRDNKLAQAISHLKARQTGQWVKRREGQPDQDIEPVYSYLGICRALADRAKEEELWDIFFRERDIPVNRVVYEDLVTNGVRALKDTLESLQIEEATASDIESRRTFLPMASSVNSEWEEQILRDQAHCTEACPENRGEDLSQLQISGIQVVNPLEVGKRHHLNVEITRKGEASISIKGRRDGTGWLRVTGILKGGNEVELEPFEQELKETSNGGYSCRCLLPVGESSGEHVLKIMLACRPMSAEEIEAGQGQTLHLQFKHPPPRDQSRTFLPDVVDLRNGWQYLDWFGYFLDDKFPWLYTSDHNWLYFKQVQLSGQRYHVFDANLGWLEIQPERYPKVWSLDQKKEWEFIKREGEKRTFKDVETGKLFEAETNRLEHLKKLNSEE